jgi:hypothetical protein
MQKYSKTKRRKRYQKNRETVLAQGKTYYERHRAERLAYQNKYYQENIDVERKRKRDLMRARRKTQARAGFVYIALDLESGLYKIGATKNITRRIARIKVGRKLRHIATIKSDYYLDDERIYHEKYRVQHVGHEWFKLTIADIMNIKKTEKRLIFFQAVFLE